MAGIGIYLSKLLSYDSITSKIQCFGYASLISSGPWVISMTCIIVLKILHNLYGLIDESILHQFQVSVTYLIALSMVTASLFQFVFTRYISDLLFLDKQTHIIPNYIGALTLNTLMSTVIAEIFCYFFLLELDWFLQALMLFSFIVLSNIWLTLCLLYGIKQYKSVAFIFAFSYTLLVALSFTNSNLTGLLGSFFISQFLLFCMMLILIFKEFYNIPKTIVSFKFIQSRYAYHNLMLIGPLLTLSLWVDKFIFWQHPITREQVLGNISACIIYDLPLYIAYITIIPGLTLFLINVETTFFNYYQKFYHAILNHFPLQTIQTHYNHMVNSAKEGINSILKIQLICILLTIMFDEKILNLLQVSKLYRHLLCIHVISASLHLIFLCLINFLFYLDKRFEIVLISTFLLITNTLLSITSIYAGPYYFGYGLAISLLLSTILAMYILDKCFSSLIQSTYLKATT